MGSVNYSVSNNKKKTDYHYQNEEKFNKKRLLKVYLKYCLKTNFLEAQLFRMTIYINIINSVSKVNTLVPYQ